MRKYCRRILCSIYGRLNSTLFYILKLFNTIYELAKTTNDRVIVNSWINYSFGTVKHNNWGDDLNVHLVEHLIGRKIISRNNVCLNNYKNYTVIGSIADTGCNSKTIIWGAGALYGGNYELKCKPLKIHAVRGKLTRQFFLSKGIDCPEVYGDPALLLPLIYKPKTNKKYKIGIIPHFRDIGNSIYIRLQERYGFNNVKIINMGSYQLWSDIVDQICSCEFVISSSLHGLIVSDAYKVPNLWVKPSFEFHGGFFKFYDYFSGVGREEKAPIVIGLHHSLEELQTIVKKYKPIEYDYRPLLKSCPFKIEMKLDNI